MEVMDPKKKKISFLWPDLEAGLERQVVLTQNDPATLDLELEELAAMLSFDRYHSINMKTLLSYLTASPEIIHYRQEIIADLIKHPELEACFEATGKIVDEIGHLSQSEHQSTNQLQQAVWRLGELDAYVQCVRDLKDVLERYELEIHSRALLNLLGWLREVAGSETFAALKEELPQLRSGLERVAGVTLGVNLDHNLRATEVTLLAVNDRPFKGENESVIGKILMMALSSGFGGASPTANTTRGMTPLLGVENKGTGMEPQYDAFQLAIFDQLNKVLQTAAKPIAIALKRYNAVTSKQLADLKPDITFILGGVRLYRKITNAGLPMCRPELRPAGERIVRVKEVYNLNLAFRQLCEKPDENLSQKIVTNDIDFGEQGRVFILTGPNRGGKTTYTQAIGMIQVLFQLGLFIPGSEAAMCPVDQILTHFPVLEKPDSNLGRLGEESKRLGEIFQRATPYSLVLFNESLASTSPGESLYMSREIVCGLKVLGTRAVFTTHLHDLAVNLEEMNNWIPGNGRLISMVSGTSKEGDGARRTYKIVPGPPEGLSYARDIAERFGISLGKLVSTLRERSLGVADIDVEACNETLRRIAHL